MKKVMLVLVALAFGLGAFGACGNPCEKAFDKYAKCLKEKGASDERVKRFKKKKEKFVEECKKEGDMGKVKKCLDVSCKDYRKCIKNANK